jgi:protein tyrosine phosphatase (PTP) superfamily phosphohydrolase (DUF442 family)
MKCVAAALFVIVFVASPAAQSADPAASGPAQSAPAAAQARRPVRIDNKYLPNSYRLTEKVISGGQPDGQQAFAALRALGVRTIISVDGAQPDVAAAKKHGLRYVHLPHGYDGIPSERLLALAKAVRDLPGPIYIHCHHGKHRSPAAAAAACSTVGLLTNDEALAVLKAAGTSPNYRGLFETVREARKVQPEVLDKLAVEFPESADIPPMADAMIAIEHIHDRLKLISAAKWRAPAEHPDLDPPHEALLLKEQFAELMRTDMVTARPEKFQAMMRASDRAAGELELALRAPKLDTARAEQAFARVTNNCTACHQVFRDVPLGEKAKGSAGRRNQ